MSFRRATTGCQSNNPGEWLADAGAGRPARTMASTLGASYRHEVRLFPVGLWADSADWPLANNR